MRPVQQRSFEIHFLKTALRLNPSFPARPSPTDGSVETRCRRRPTPPLVVVVVVVAVVHDETATRQRRRRRRRQHIESTFLPVLPPVLVLAVVEGRWKSSRSTARRGNIIGQVSSFSWKG
jgi:hypothetical protein